MWAGWISAPGEIYQTIEKGGHSLAVYRDVDRMERWLLTPSTGFRQLPPVLPGLNEDLPRSRREVARVRRPLSDPHCRNHAAELKPPSL